MNKTGSTLIGILAFLVGAWAVRAGFDRYRDSTASSAAREAIADIRAEAARKHPDLPAGEAMRQEAVERSSQRLASEPDTDKRLANAASAFMGFYLVNTRERSLYCKEQGVDIQPFVTAFQQAHQPELAKAKSQLAKVGITEDQLYDLTRKQLREVIAQDMKDLATAGKSDVAGACQTVASNGETLAKELHISKSQPAVYQTLNSAP